MKAVAGAPIEEKREVAQDVPAASQDPKQRPEYVAAISKAKKRHPQLAVLIEKTECFAVLWKDDVGICPNDGKNGELCEIRSQCQQAWDEAQVRVRVAEEVEKVSPEIVEQVRVTEEKAQRKKARRKPRDKRSLRHQEETTRGKWKGTGKYQRLGYQNLGRPVDHALVALIDALGKPKVLPKMWNPVDFKTKYGELGRIVLSQTVSYTSVICDGHTVLRFWTNAGGCAIIDIVPELVSPIGSIKGVGKVTAIPDGSKKKLRPCTHRFLLPFGSSTHKDTLGTIGNMVRMAFR